MRSIAVLIALMAAALPLMEKGVEAQGIPDARAQHVRTNQEGSGFKPFSSRDRWQERKQRLREQILVSCGLYPMPEKTPLNAKVYGRAERDGYTLEKVVLETLPGVYLSGNLYRPTLTSGKSPGILNPHGHWPEGRVAADLQARCIGQARMGAVAFLYDMVGYVDSKPFGHAFGDDELSTLGMNLPGLQLWNSIRALDWLSTLPDVDPSKLACTGESGGGTQTFLVCAVDDRIAVAAPVCMVSHGFQGGCTCENAPLLRIGTDNVEFAAMFAPKPQLLVGATGDWTAQIRDHGVPEIRSTYGLFKSENNILSVVHDAGHNYNQTSRESVYTFFKQYLWGVPTTEPLKEASFKPEDEKGLTTWDAEHPRPADAATPAKLTAYLHGVVDKQIAEWRPASASQWRQSRAVIKTALSHLLACELPKPAELVSSGSTSTEGYLPGYVAERITLARKDVGDRSTAVLLSPEGTTTPNAITVVAHPAGIKGALADPSVKALIEESRRRGQGLLLLDAFLIGQPDAVAKRQASPFYTTYNKTVLAERVQDVLNAVAYARGRGKSVNLLGLGAAGPWVVLARPFAGDIRRTAADAAAWEWPAALPSTSEMLLPAAGHYGGMKAFAALVAPDPLFMYGTGAGLDTSWVDQAYHLEGARVRLQKDAPAAGELVAWIVD